MRVALVSGEPRATAAVKRWLETKNDESRFCLTRAPFFKRRGSLGRGQSLARHRAAQSGNRRYQRGHILFAALTDESNLQWLVVAALALIYGSAVMAIVIVTLMKSARARASETSKEG